MSKKIQAALCLLLSLLFLSILKIYHPLTPIYELLLVYVIVLFIPKYKVELIGLSSVIYFVFFMTDYQTFKYGNLVHAYAKNLQIPEKLFSLLLFFLVYKCLKIFITQAQKIVKLNSSFLGILLIPVAGAATYEFLKNFDVPINPFLAPILIAKSVWFFSVYLKENETKLSWFGKTNNLFHLLPALFFQRYEARETYNLKKYLVQDDDEQLAQSKMGLFYVVRGVLVILLLELAGKNLLTLFGVDPTQYRYFNDYVLDLNLTYPAMSTLQLWITLLFSAFDFLFSTYYGYFGLCIGVFRLFGFKMSSPTNEPWKANSFGDFCWRFMYYYSFILMNYFYIPFLNIFSKLKINTQFRKNMSLFLAVSLGGFYFHLINDFYYCYDKGYLKTFTYYFNNYMPLMALWAAIVVLGVNFKLEIKSKVISFSLFFVVYTLISTFRLLFKFDSFESFVLVYAKLFGFS